MKCAILCGGLATRLRPLTDNLPKSLVDVNGKPFIAWQLELLKQQGITDIVLCVGHLGEMIQDVVGDGSQYGVDVAYSFDGNQPLGTAGALRKAIPLLDGMFMVMYGDSFLECDYSCILREFVDVATLVVTRNDNPRHRNNVLMYGDHLVLYDKQYPSQRMKHIDYGLSLLSDAALFELSSSTNDLSEVYYHLSCQEFLDAYEVDAPLYNIGSFEGLEETRQYLKEKA